MVSAVKHAIMQCCIQVSFCFIMKHYQLARGECGDMLSQLQVSAAPMKTLRSASSKPIVWRCLAALS